MADQLLLLKYLVENAGTIILSRLPMSQSTYIFCSYSCAHTVSLIHHPIVDRGSVAWVCLRQCASKWVLTNKFKCVKPI